MCGSNTLIASIFCNRLSIEEIKIQFNFPSDNKNVDFLFYTYFLNTYFGTVMSGGSPYFPTVTLSPPMLRFGLNPYGGGRC